MADHLVGQVGPSPKVRIIDTAYITVPPQQPGGWQGMESSSILEPMVRLHRLTGKPQYLEFARYIVEVEGGSKRGSIFEAALAGTDVRDFGGDGVPAHRIAHAYTIISCFEGLLEYHRDTGNDRWQRAASASMPTPWPRKRPSSAPRVAWARATDWRPPSSSATPAFARRARCRPGRKVVPTPAG